MVSSAPIVIPERMDLKHISESFSEKQSSLIETIYPAISILKKYPPKVIAEIFSFIEPHEFKIIDNDLYSAYLPFKYRAITVNHTSHSVPRIESTFWPLYHEEKWFKPETLEVWNSEHFHLYPDISLKTFKNVNLRCEANAEDMEKITHMENIRTMVFNMELQIPSTLRLPRSLRKLEFFNCQDSMVIVSLSTQYSNLEDLNISFKGNNEESRNLDLILRNWSKLKVLSLSGAGLDFQRKFPVSLVRLDLSAYDIPDSIDLEYLVNVTSLKTGLIKNSRLPKSIRCLSCRGMTNFFDLDKLKVVNVESTNGTFILPSSVEIVRFTYCQIELGNPSELTNLQQLRIVGGSISPKLPWENLQYLEEIFISTADAVVFTSLPRKLKTIHLQGLSVKFDFNWPITVEKISLSNVILDFDTFKLPGGLKNLSLCDMNLVGILKTNIQALKLDTFSMENCNSNAGDEFILTGDICGNLQPQKLQPNIKNFYLTDCLFELLRGYFRDTELLTCINLNKCGIETSYPVQLPTSVKELSITECNMTSKTWAHFKWPSKLKRLDLRYNRLTSFGSITEHLDEANFSGNRIPASVIQDIGVETDGWTLTFFKRIEDIGECYTIEAENKQLRVALSKELVLVIDNKLV